MKEEVLVSQMPVKPTSFLCLSLAVATMLFGLFSCLLYMKPLPSNDLFPQQSKNDITRDNSFASPCCTTLFHSSTARNDDYDDVKLLRLASLSSPHMVTCEQKKVAFMFLTKGRMPLRPLWERFFGGHNGYFSIYLHSSPDYKEEPPETSIFFNTRIPSKPVQWGQASVVAAERRLLATALLADPCNHRFVLLSESCIPLYNFSTVYSHLTTSLLSHIHSSDVPGLTGRGRYNPVMHPHVTSRDWRKGSQWFEVDRHLALEIVKENKYFPLFRRHCRPPCYVDEHYLQTWVEKVHPWMNSGRSLTWVDWSRVGSHPTTFRGRDVTERLVGRMRGGRRCNKLYDTSSVCFLFARKFDGSTLGPLLRLAPKSLEFS